MLSILLPLASKVISDAVNKIPENEELGEKLIEICLIILKKAVKLTKTDMDDKLLEQVEAAIKARQSIPFININIKINRKTKCLFGVQKTRYTLQVM